MIPDIIRDAETKMANAVEYAKEEFAAIRTGRAHPAMFVKLTADYYGSPTPLQQLATFQVPDARVILITPYDPSAMTAIEKSIRDSDLGVNPSNDGTQHPGHPAAADRGAAQGVHQAGQDQGRGCPDLGPRRTGGRPRRRWTRWSRTPRSARTRWSAPRSSWTPSTKKHTDAIDDVLKHKEAELLEV